MKEHAMLCVPASLPLPQPVPGPVAQVLCDGGCGTLLRIRLPLLLDDRTDLDLLCPWCMFQRMTAHPEGIRACSNHGGWFRRAFGSDELSAEQATQLVERVLVYTIMQG